MLLENIYNGTEDEEEKPIVYRQKSKGLLH